MKLLITTLFLAVLACACRNDFTATQKVSEKDAGPEQTHLSGNEGQAHSFTANTFDHIFFNTKKLNPIVLTKKIFIPKNNAAVTGSINVETKEITTAKEIVLNDSRKQPHNYPVDFLFVSLIMVN